MDEIFPRWFCHCGRGSYATHCRCGKKRPLGLRSWSSAGTEADAEAALAAAVVVVPTASKGWCPVLPAEVIDDYLEDLAQSAACAEPIRKRPPSAKVLAARAEEQVALANRDRIYTYLDELAEAAK